MIVALVFLAVVTLSAAAYAQHRVPYHVESRPKALLARIVLALTGAAFGFVLAIVYQAAGGEGAVLVMLTGFGLAHVPAAVILHLKRVRRR